MGRATARREGRADAARRLNEAHKLLDEVSNVLIEMRRVAGRRPLHVMLADNGSAKFGSNAARVDLRGRSYISAHGQCASPML